LLTGCGSAQETAPTQPGDALEWAACDEVECATLSMPLDQFAAKSHSSAWIDLRVYRQISSVADSRHLPLFIHPGGPGADVRAAVAGARAVLAPIIDDFDIYALSTRGTVDGTPFDCGASLHDLRVIDVDGRAAGRFATNCVEKSGSLVGRVGTRQSVEDLEDLRVALGFGSVRFLGWSYGATLGAAWAMAYPESIRAMVLDAPSDPRRPWAEQLRERYVAASAAFARSSLSNGIDIAGNARESALAREYLLYEPDAVGSGSELIALRLGETPNGDNDGGIEAQVGVHCADVTHAAARMAIDVVEPRPKIGLGATFDRVCLEFAESSTPLVAIDVDPRGTRVDVMVISTTGDHVVASVVSRRLAKDMSWRGFVVDADRHLSVGFDPVATKEAMEFLAIGE